MKQRSHKSGKPWVQRGPGRNRNRPGGHPGGHPGGPPGGHKDPYDRGDFPRPFRPQERTPRRAVVAFPYESSGRSLDRIVETVGESKKELVLDVTAGAGHTGLALAPHVAHVVLCDERAASLTEARHAADERGLGNVTPLVSEFESLPFPNGTFNTVVARMTPSRFRDIRACMRELARVTAKGGRVIVVDNLIPMDREIDDFLNQLERNQNPAHVRYYNTKEWKVLFADAGLKVQTMDEELVENDEGLHLHDWLDRAGASDQSIRKITGMLISANAKIKQSINLRIERGEMFVKPKRVVMIGGK